MIPPRTSIRLTPNLSLRPSEPADAAAAFAIRSDWEVTRMLRMARFPPDRDEMAAWFADHPRQWATGEAYRFAVDCEGRMVGIADLDEIRDRGADLGYWYARSAWGRGTASAVGEFLVRFAFAVLDLARLRSGHATDNPASGRVLIKLGFQPTDPCASRRAPAAPRSCSSATSSIGSTAERRRADVQTTAAGRDEALTTRAATATASGTNETQSTVSQP